LENAILKSKKQYDTLVTNIPIGIFLLRTSIQNTYAFEYISPKIEEMLEVSAESILLNPQAAFHMFHPDDKDELVRLNQEHLRNLKPFDWEGRAVIKGSIKWLRISSYPEPLENGDVLWNGVITDITQPKLADELRFASELRYR
jgi:PAS domain S-box-containing protein